MYNFTEFAVQMNEPEPGVAPTDSRLRPDQRFMEEGNWDEANREKLRLEEKQRTVRKQREIAYNSSDGQGNSTDVDVTNSRGNSQEDEDDDEDLSNLANGKMLTNTSHDPDPLWFKKTVDPYTNQPIHLFNNEYWECKAKQDWKRCPDLF